MAQKIYSVENEVNTLEQGVWRYLILGISTLAILVIGLLIFFFLTNQSTGVLIGVAVIIAISGWFQIGGGVANIRNDPRHAGVISIKNPVSGTAGTLVKDTALLDGSMPLRPWEIVSTIDTSVKTGEIKDAIYTAKNNRRVRMTISFSTYTSNPPKSLSITDADKIVANAIKAAIGIAVKESDAEAIILDSQTLIVDKIRLALRVNDAIQDPQQAEIEEAAKIISVINIAGNVEFEDPDAQEEFEADKKYDAATRIYAKMYPNRMNPDGTIRRFVKKDHAEIMNQLNLESGKITQRNENITFDGLTNASHVYYGPGGGGAFNQAGGGGGGQKPNNQKKARGGHKNKAGGNTQPNNP